MSPTTFRLTGGDRLALKWLAKELRTTLTGAFRRILEDAVRSRGAHYEIADNACTAWDRPRGRPPVVVHFHPPREETPNV